MRKNKLYPVLIFLTIICSLPAQTSSGVDISGVVTDRNHNPLESAAVILLQADDSSYVTGVITNGTGEFRIPNVKPRQYILNLSMLGYNKKYTPIEVPESAPYRLDTIRMEENPLWLSAVTVVGRRSSMKMEPGSTLFTMGTGITGSGGNALDALRSLPGVTVNEDGSVAMSGQGGVQLLINGKATYISNEQLVNYLRSMPASSIKNIELITHPPARYSASGKSGLINIQTQTINTEGWTIQANTGYQQSSAGKWNAGNRIAYRRNRLGLFADYSRNDGKYRFTLDTHRATSFDSETGQRTMTVDQSSRMKDKIKSDWMRVGLNYDINSRILIGISSSAHFFRKHSPGETVSRFKTLHDTFQGATPLALPVTASWPWFGILNNPADSMLQTGNKIEVKQRMASGGGQLNYKNKNNVTADFSIDYLLYAHDEDAFMNNEMVYPVPKAVNRDTLTGDLEAGISIYSFQGDFSKPWGDKWKLSAGAKYTRVAIDNSALYTRRGASGEEINHALSKATNHNEQIGAAYFQMNGHFGKINLHGGARAEHTRVSGVRHPPEKTADSFSYDDNYFQLFPVFTAQYQFPRTGNTISLLYNRRIARPNYRDLSPFNYIWDEYTRSTGNPELKPELVNNTELAYMHGKVYRVTLFHARVKDPIMQHIKMGEDNVATIYPANFKNSQRLGIRADIGELRLNRWWGITANATGFRGIYRWEEFEEPRELRLFTPSLSMNNLFSLPGDWSGELLGFYNGRMAFGQSTINPHWSVSLAAQKKFPGDKFILRIHANDIFQSNRQDIDLSFAGNRGKANTRQFNDYRAIGISLSFNFNKGEKTKKSIREATIDQSKRINL